MTEIVVPPFVRARHTDHAFDGKQAMFDVLKLYTHWTSFTADFADGVGHLSYVFRTQDEPKPEVVSRYLEVRLTDLALLNGQLKNPDSVTRIGWVAINMFKPITYEACDDIDVEISEPFDGIDVLPVLTNSISVEITVRND